MAKALSDREISRSYEEGKFRVTQEKSDFLLHQIIDFVQTRNWVNPNPEYQRRLVWDVKKKSLLIESLLMNVPVPPIFLYEYELNRYEVMDGQQRLNTIIDFYNNRFTLKGLKTWPSLNGRKYDDCPLEIKRGLDRRRISATVILVESSSFSRESGEDLRRIVFERLNTGGINLNPQEIRNCLFSSEFNEGIIRLAGDRLFNNIWGIPPYEDNIDKENNVSKKLLENGYYKRMKDCQIILRFFAFRKRSKIKGSVKTILDHCMKENMRLNKTDVAELENIFLSRLKLAYDIFGEETFKIQQSNKKYNLSIPLYDSVMIAIDQLWDRRNELTSNKDLIKKDLQNKIKDTNLYEYIVGRPNTAKAIKHRLDAVLDIINECI